MCQEFLDLLEEFKIISKKRWIESVNNIYNGVGLTFEKELNKLPDSFYFPDYEGIELKCSTRYSKNPLYLFTLAFDGPTFPEINRIVDLYGHPDSEFPDKNVLFTNLNVKEKHSVDDKFKFRLKVEREEGKIYLEVFDMNDNLIEKESFVYIDSLYNHLNLKLKNLAVVTASKKSIDGKFYYRYYKIQFYELKDNFLDLLENDIIDVELVARVGKSGSDRGRYRNKNLVFKIPKHKIEELFTKIFEYDSDIEENINNVFLQKNTKKKSRNFNILHI